MQFDPYDITQTGYEQLLKICPPNTFRVLEPKDMPVQFPASLMNKVVGIVVVGSGDAMNMVYMVNLIRRDEHARALDQQPLAIAQHNGTLTAGFIQHGSWVDRTVRVSGDFLAAVEGSGIIHYYPYARLPEKSSGDIRELEPHSQKEAFWNVVKSTKS